MEDQTVPKQPSQSPLQKPPGYKDPNTAPSPASSPVPPPPGGQSPYRKASRQLPPALHKKSRRCSCCRCCCCCLLFFLIFLLFLTLAIIAFSAAVYVFYRPTLPDFHLQSMRTEQLDVVVGPDGATVSSDVVARVQATNSNEKVELNYGPTRFRVTTTAGPGGEVVGLGQSTVPGFVQQTGNVIVLAFEAKVTGLAIDDDVGQVLKAGLASGKAELGVEMKTSVGLRVGKIRSGPVQVLVSCGPVTMKQLDDGETPKCKIKVFDWITLP